jgi:hypothetical protein
MKTNYHPTAITKKIGKKKSEPPQLTLPTKLNKTLN